MDSGCLGGRYGLFLPPTLQSNAGRVGFYFLSRGRVGRWGSLDNMVTVRPELTHRVPIAFLDTCLVDLSFQNKFYWQLTTNPTSNHYYYHHHHYRSHSLPLSLIPVSFLMLKCFLKYLQTGVAIARDHFFPLSSSLENCAAEAGAEMMKMFPRRRNAHVNTGSR